MSHICEPTPYLFLIPGKDQQDFPYLVLPYWLQIVSVFNSESVFCLYDSFGRP